MLTAVSSPTLTVMTHSLDETIRRMKYLIERYFIDVCGLGVRSLLEAFDFVKQLPYVEDKLAPECNGVEECVKRPKWTLEYGGDCDDKVILMASFAKCLGVPYRIVTVAYDATREHVHTYLELLVEGLWRPVDATYSKNRLYEEHPYVEKRVW